MILADNDVPSTLIIGNGTMTRATRPEGNELIYINQGLSPAARYCVFIVTQQNTSIPGVSTTLLLLLIYSRVKTVISFLFNRFIKQATPY